MCIWLDGIANTALLNSSRLSNLGRDSLLLLTSIKTNDSRYRNFSFFSLPSTTNKCTNPRSWCIYNPLELGRQISNFPLGTCNCPDAVFTRLNPCIREGRGCYPQPLCFYFLGRPSTHRFFARSSVVSINEAVKRGAQRQCRMAEGRSVVIN